MENIRAAIDRIRSFFGAAVLPEQPRKRRAPDTIDILLSPKYRKTQMSSNSPWSADWYAKTNNISFKKSPKAPIRQQKVIDTVVLDDDDDLVEIKRTNRKKSVTGFTSTPAENRTHGYVNGNVENGDDDEIAFVKEIKTQNAKKDEARRAGFNYIQPFSGRLFNIGSYQQNGTKHKERKPLNGLGTKIKTHQRSPALASPSIDFSFRLDDKFQYKKLLENAGSTSPESQSFHTPCGKLFQYDNTRSGRILRMTPKSFNSSLNNSKERKSTRDTIIKVLDDFENEPVVVKDSDSEKDDVIFVSPPSPKPDIKVEPVNSLKTVIDTSKETNPDWLSSLVEKHKRYIATREKEIQELRECAERHGTINKDMELERLRQKVKSCLSIKEAILPVDEESEETALPELTESDLQMVKTAFRGDPNEVLAKKFNLNITRRDLQTLAGLNWLNDEVINFYMNLIIERGKDAKWPNSYAFNTFFYTKLTKDGPASLRRWTKRIDLFSYDFVCVPIHLGMHWCMAIINFREKSIRYYDSMGSPNNRCLEALKNYLEAEHLDKKKTEFDTSGFSLENMKDIPQQMNGSDCGMFACTFAEFITRNAKITFNQEDMQYLRKKMVVEIMTGDLLIK